MKELSMLPNGFLGEIFQLWDYKVHCVVIIYMVIIYILKFSPIPLNMSKYFILMGTTG